MSVSDSNDDSGLDVTSVHNTLTPSPSPLENKSEWLKVVKLCNIQLYISNINPFKYNIVIFCFLNL